MSARPCRQQLANRHSHRVVCPSSVTCTSLRLQVLAHRHLSFNHLYRRELPAPNKTSSGRRRRIRLTFISYSLCICCTSGKQQS